MQSSISLLFVAMSVGCIIAHSYTSPKSACWSSFISFHSKHGMISKPAFWVGEICCHPPMPHNLTLAFWPYISISQHNIYHDKSSIYIWSQRLLIAILFSMVPGLSIYHTPTSQNTPVTNGPDQVCTPIPAHTGSFSWRRAISPS